MFYFRIEGDDNLIFSIFEISSIKKEFEKSFLENKSIVRETVKKYKDFIFSLYLGGKLDENLPSEKEMEACLTDGNIIADFRRELQRKIINHAVNEIFYLEELNVEENIIRILRSDFIEREASKLVFDCILMRICNIDVNDYIYVELMAHFFPCSKSTFELDLID